MQNFGDYIEILKILRNMCTKDYNFLKLVWNAFLSFVKKPSLFLDNLEELFEVDELHTILFKLNGPQALLENFKNNRLKAK